VTGTIVARSSVSLTAPRILGSRSGFNRGGDTSFGTPAGAGISAPGAADFNLTLLRLAKAGTHVRVGDIVAQFDPQNQVQRLDDYKDSVVQMENNLRSILASATVLREAHEQQVRSARADWNKAILDLQTAPTRSEIDAEDYKLAVEETEATYKALRLQTPLVEESQQAQIRAAELNLDQARIELQRAEANVRKMTIKAPIDGVVVMASIVRNGEVGQIREGDQVNAGQPFMSIVDPRSMVLDANVNQVDAERLRLGMKAAVHLDAYPGVELPGTVTGMGAMSKESSFRANYVGELPVRITINGTDQHLIPDLTGSAEIVLKVDTGTVAIPRAAIFEQNGVRFVYCKQADGWTRRQVQVGTESFTVAAIRGGLETGATVALAAPEQNQ
jgi:RND family efflux transporter MFP subunit